MGVAFSSLWSSLFGSKELKICILGLDNAGKTTLMYKMTLGSVVSTAPTVGSNTEQFEYKNLKFMLWDVGGQTSLRSSWTSYLTSTDAIIFVLDSNDRERVQLAKEELFKIAADEQVSSAPILIWANKQDIKGSMNPAEISSALGLTAFRDRNWQIFGCSALTGKGITEGLDWLATTLGAKGFSYEKLVAQASPGSDSQPVPVLGNSSTIQSTNASASSVPDAKALAEMRIDNNDGKQKEELQSEAEEEEKMESAIASILSQNRRTATQFTVDKHSKEASKNWDKFYHKHTTKFFKDRHWTNREFGAQLGPGGDGDSGNTGKSNTVPHGSVSTGVEDEDSRIEESQLVSHTLSTGKTAMGTEDSAPKVLLEVGCGVGNMLYPLLENDPELRVHCCDFSSRAIDLVRQHPLYDDTRINAFVMDLTSPDLVSTLLSSLRNPKTESWGPVSTISLIFVLSAIAPSQHKTVLSNLVHLLLTLNPGKGGNIIFRDYSWGDTSQLRYHLKKDAAWSQNPSLLSQEAAWYKRGDNTFNYFFQEQELQTIADQLGLKGEIKVIKKWAVNRKKEQGRQRRFIQATWFVDPTEDRPNTNANANADADPKAQE